MMWFVFVAASFIVVCTLAGLVAIALDGMDEEVEMCD